MNFCKDCQWHELEHSGNRRACFHIKNLSEPNPIHGGVYRIKDIVIFRDEVCNGALFKPKVTLMGLLKELIRRKHDGK